MKQKIIQLFNYQKEIFVVNSSCTTGLKSAKDIDNSIVLSEYNILPEKYILSVATNNKRKNIIALERAFSKISQNYPDIKLVLVGSNYKQNQNNDNIITTGYISDEKLKVLYKNALIYVFPSVYEGFGTPLIDAQSFGVPVICTDIAVFKEVGTGSVEYFSLQKNDLAEKIIELINDEQKRNELISKGYENIKRFSYENIKKQIYEALK